MSYIERIIAPEEGENMLTASIRVGQEVDADKYPIALVVSVFPEMIVVRFYESEAEADKEYKGLVNLTAGFLSVGMMPFQTVRTVVMAMSLEEDEE